MSKLAVREIFKSLGLPTSTYVKRDKGKYEKELSDALNTKGKIALLTGPSKTGKTSLYMHVLAERGQDPLVIRCDHELSTQEFWRQALEKVDFERISGKVESAQKKIGASGKIGGKLGWAWLAGITGEVGVSRESQQAEATSREKILSQPSPSHLIPILKNLPLVLVVEDFHYLSDSVKKSVFQQWKTFSDNEVSVIVVGTTHHAADLAHANPDLVGRTAQIDLSRWENKDLQSISVQGFLTLGINVAPTVHRFIAEESAGLPIIVQEVSALTMVDKGFSEIDPGAEDIQITSSDVSEALHKIAVTQYKHFDVWYERIRSGPRERARKYNTYELALISFCDDPLTFSLRRSEIDDRISKLNLPASERPPTASINSMLAALKKFQRKNGIELLEWSEIDQRLYIIEPTFLFYLRWREKKRARSKQKDLLQLLMDLVVEKASSKIKIEKP